MVGHARHFDRLEVDPVFDIRDVATKLFHQVYDFRHFCVVRSVISSVICSRRLANLSARLWLAKINTAMRRAMQDTMSLKFGLAPKTA